MTFDHSPHHGPRNLAARTVTAVLSTAALVLTIVLVVIGLPQGVLRALQGPIPTLAAVQVAPLEPERTLACMGPALSFGTQVAAPVGYGAATTIVSGPSAALQSVAETDVQDAFSLEPVPVPEPLVIVTQPADAGALAGSSFQQLDNQNVRGLALSECQEPRTDTWLVGADTTTGRQAVLSLTNPGAVLATVNVDVWGQSGSISSPLGQGILVPPGAQRTFSLAGFAPDEPRPVLRISSQGTGVVAALHHSIVRGLEADGLSVITGQPEPGTTRVITGLYSPPEEVIGPVRGKEGYADVGGLLRVLAPDEDAEVSIRIVKSGFSDITTQLSLLAGQVGDIALDQIGAGDYSIIVESDVPVVAGVRNSVGNDTRTDTSWVGSSYPVTNETAFSVPGIGETRLTLMNPGSEAITVTLDGRPTSVAAGAMVVRPISAGDHTLSADGPVVAVVSAKGETIVGHLQVLPAPVAQEPVTLRIR